MPHLCELLLVAATFLSALLQHLEVADKLIAKYAGKSASGWLLEFVTVKKDKQEFQQVAELITGILVHLNNATLLELSLQPPHELPSTADFRPDMEAAAAKVLELSGETDVKAGLRKLARSNNPADLKAVADLLGGSPGSGSAAVLDALADSEQLLKDIGDKVDKVGDKVDKVGDKVDAMHEAMRDAVGAHCWWFVIRGGIPNLLFSNMCVICDQTN